MDQPQGWRAVSACLAALALTVACPAYLTWVVASTGADCPSNDIVATAPIVDQVLAGTYSWARLLPDSCLGGRHCMLIPILIRLFIAFAFHWNIYYELYATLLFAGLKLVLLHRALARGTPRGRQMVLWPVLSALVFSLSQVNVFTFGDAGLPIELTQLGLALGIWGLARFPARWTGVLVAGCGGLLACFSGGGGPIAWPAFLLGMVLLGFRRPAHYLLYFGLAFLGGLPYLILRFQGGHSPQGVGPWFSTVLFCQGLGYPFANGFNLKQAGWHGACGAALGILGILLVAAWRRSVSWARLAPAFMLLVYGLAVIWVTEKCLGALAPWYPTAFLSYWLGLAGLAYGLWATPFPVGRPRWAPACYGGAFLALLAYLLVRTNLTYEDKVFYLISRAPASAACLRHYRTAPTYAERLVFQWGVGRPHLFLTLGQILERHGLGVFASRQQWSLQGDFALATVTLTEADDAPPVEWRHGTDPTPRSYDDYKHLDLLLHPPDEVHWQVTLPRGAHEATFHSAVRAGPASPADGVECRLEVEDSRGQRRLAWSHRLSVGQDFWAPCHVALEGQAGETLTLHLSTRLPPDGTPGAVLWRYPVIDLDCRGADASQEAGPVAPSNTDLSPLQPRPSARDTHLFLPGKEGWTYHGMEAAAETPGTWRLAQEPFLSSGALAVPLGDYSHLYVRLAVPPEITPRSYRLWLSLDGQPPRIVDVPLLGDGALHTYTYDLKLLGPAHRATLTALRLAPVPHLDESTRGKVVEIAGVGLIRKRTGR